MFKAKAVAAGGEVADGAKGHGFVLMGSSPVLAVEEVDAEVDRE